MNFFLYLILLNTFALSQGSESPKLEINRINNIQYFSAIDYAETSNIKTVFVKTKEKLIIQYGSKKIVLSPSSSFVLVNDILYNISVPVIYDGNDFWVPLNSFSRIIKTIDLPELKIDSSEKYALLSIIPKNILGCSFERKENGVLIKIKTQEDFEENKVSATVTRGGWLNINIAEGSIDSIALINNTKLIKPILKIRPIQLEKSAQLSFLFNDKIDDYDISVDNASIRIGIRSKSEISAQKIKKMKDRWNLDVIVIDAGHGGKDPGCLDNGLMEKDITLDVSKMLGNRIEREMGIKVIYTRTEDEFIPLWKRTKIANDSGGKLFISVHVNASPKSSSARGFETFIIRPGKFDDATEVAQRENKVIELEDSPKKYPKLSKENLIIATMAQASFTKQSEFLAGEIQSELSERFTAPNRGVKQAGFHVLVGASMPNVLVELGFITNKKDHRLLSQKKYRKKMADSIYEAILSYKSEYEQSL